MCVSEPSRGNGIPPDIQSDSHISRSFPYPFPTNSQKPTLRARIGPCANRTSAHTCQTRSTAKVRLFDVDFGDCRPAKPPEVDRLRERPIGGVIAPVLSRRRVPSGRRQWDRAAAGGLARWRCLSSARPGEVGGQGPIGAEVQVDVAHQRRADREALGPRDTPMTVADRVETRD